MTSLHTVLSCLTPAVESLGGDDFHQVLVDCLQQLVPSKERVIVLFAERPQIQAMEKEGKLHDAELETYISGAYLLDPYFRAGLDKKASGFFSYEALAPEGFKASEYYKQYLGSTGVLDECGWLIQFPGGEFINFSMDRGEGEKKFTKQELALLKDLSPLLEALFHKHWLPRLDADTGFSALNHQLDDALQNFACSKVSPRESEIIHLVLQGHSSNSIAERLNISPETVRLHRRNAYRKLDIGSQSELFHLFLSALKRFESYPGGDPLDGFF